MPMILKNEEPAPDSGKKAATIPVNSREHEILKMAAAETVARPDKKMSATNLITREKFDICQKKFGDLLVEVELPKGKKAMAEGMVVRTKEKAEAANEYLKGSKPSYKLKGGAFEVVPSEEMRAARSLAGQTGMKLAAGALEKDLAQHQEVLERLGRALPTDFLK